MTYVIGDIHGEYAKLLSLLKYIPEGEKLVFIGDYIDKGKDSRLVVDYLKKMKRKAVFLLGNHEFKLLKALAGDKKAKAYLKEYGFKPTLESYRGGKISQKEFERLLESGQFRSLLRTDLPFFRSLKKYYREGEYIVVHAGIPLDRFGKYRLAPLEKMLFIRDQFFQYNKRFDNKIVVFGHTAFKRVFWDGCKLGIDTGATYKRCNGYGRLTAVDLDKFECLDSDGKRYKPVRSKWRKSLVDRKKWEEL